MTKLPGHYQPTPNPASPLPHPSSSSFFFSSTSPPSFPTPISPSDAYAHLLPLEGGDWGVGMVSDLGCDGLGKEESGLFVGGGCEVVWVVCRR
ncbi:hypothetical protein PRUPE_5G072900 [Prunus persica]|uniref:Uncharacterized protein n=1 Tax=Prunus persica TaxID=3760 RepID=A0A251P514_PRUPE|nr:hypothetical protein PRUPE_5G072900 [Prunus persica]